MPKKVLICDDEPYILESVSYVAREGGYEVFTAEDGEEAIALAKQERPNLIFLDLQRPDIEAGEQLSKAAISELRERFQAAGLSVWQDLTDEVGGRDWWR